MLPSGDLLTLAQKKLAGLGYYTLAIDGEDGPGTANAIIDFKTHNGLRPRAYVGPLTHKKIFSNNAVPAPVSDAPIGHGGKPLWIQEARRLLGVHEVAGTGDNSIIMKWARDLNQWYTGDDVPWCGLFVAHCMQVGVPDEPQKFNRLGARAWGNFGKHCKPQYGAIAVFWRTHKINSFNGHVGFIIGEDDTYYYILGGNQGDSVSIARVRKDRLLDCRCPIGWAGDNRRLGPVDLTTNSNKEH